MSSGTEWGDPRGGPGRIKRPLGRSGRGRRTLGEVQKVLREPRGGRNGSGDFGEVPDGSRISWGGLGRVGGILGWFGTGRETVWEVCEGSRNARGVPGRVGGTSLRSWTGRKTLGQVRDGLGNRRGGTGRVRVPSGRSGMGRWSLGKVRYNSRLSQVGPGWVGGTRGG